MGQMADDNVLMLIENDVWDYGQLGNVGEDALKMGQKNNHQTA
jgi:hypothetical protein